MESKQPKRNRPLKVLPQGWEARQGLNGRVYYHNLTQQSINILPPTECWSCSYNLPYGWELGQDGAHKYYFINHILQQTTYDDPRVAADGSCPTPSEPPHPRQYTLTRDARLGFGFIAGSDRPIVVRSVTPDGPADGKLLPGDQIINVGEKFVANSPRESVLDLIRNSPNTVALTVVQPVVVLNSCFIKPNRKHVKGMNRPKVRFSESEDDFELPKESSLLNPSGDLRVVLEEGDSRFFQFHSDTTAEDVIGRLCKKLDIKQSKHYSLILVPKKPRSVLPKDSFSKFSDDIIVNPSESVSQILTNSNYKYHQCHLRLAFVAKDVHQMLHDDPNSFNYLYHQCVNDVLSGTVFHEDLSSEELLRLASLHMLVVCLLQEEKASDSSRSSSKKKSIYSPSKFNLKHIEKEFGLEKFLPKAMIELFISNPKEHRKILQNYIKVNHANYIINSLDAQPTSPTSSPSIRQVQLSLETLLTRLKMQYIKSLSHYHMYGGRYFEATILAVVDSDIVLLAGHHYGISQLINSKTKMSSAFAGFMSIDQIEVAPPKPNRDNTNVRVEFKDMAPLVLNMHRQSALNFAYFVSGYCRLYGNEDFMLTIPDQKQKSAPDYCGPHHVKQSHWNYPPDLDSSSLHCDFSNPVTFSLLSDEIPLSVREMFQQSRVIEEEDENYSSSSDDATKEPNDIEDGKITLSQVDERVATAAVDTSPKSSVSSVVGTSPSSGIRSLTPRVGSGVREQIDSSGKNPNSVARSSENSDASAKEIWSEIMDAVDEQATAKKDAKLHEKESLEEESKDEQTNAKEAVEHGVDETEMEDAASLENKVARGGGLIVSHENGRENFLDKESRNENNVFFPSGQPKSTFDMDQTTTGSRNRFSSFKPSESPETNDKSSPANSHPSSASFSLEKESPEISGGKILTSEEFQKELQKENFRPSSPIPVLDGDTDDIATSPLPVEDLAKGHKGLKTGRKNRFSWTRSNKKSRFQFSKFFFSRRNHSSRKSYSLEEESSKKRRWRWFGLFRSSSTPSKKTRFSFFKSINRKRKSHDFHSSTLSDATDGAYCVFEARDAGKRMDVDALKPAASFNDVSLRQRDVVDDKPRPVSFMTFQKVSNDTDDDEESDDDRRDKLAPFHPSANPSTPIIVEQTSSSFNKSNAEANDQAPASSHQVKNEISDYDTKTRSSSRKGDLNSISFPSKESKVSVAQATRIKRKAPPPPSLASASQKNLDRSSSKASNADAEVVSVDSQTDRNAEGTLESDSEEGYESVVSITSSQKFLAHSDVGAAHEEYNDNHIESPKCEDVDLSSITYTEQDKVVSESFSQNEKSTPPDDVSSSSEASITEEKTDDDLASQIFSTLNMRENSQNSGCDHDDNDDDNDRGDDNGVVALSTEMEAISSDPTELIGVDNSVHSDAKDKDSDNSYVDDKSDFKMVENEIYTTLVDTVNMVESETSEIMSEDISNDFSQLAFEKKLNCDDSNDDVVDDEIHSEFIDSKNKDQITYSKGDKELSISEQKDALQDVSSELEDDSDKKSLSSTDYRSDFEETVEDDKKIDRFSTLLNRLLNGADTSSMSIGVNGTKESNERSRIEPADATIPITDSNPDLRDNSTMVNGNVSVSDNHVEEFSSVHLANRDQVSRNKTETEQNGHNADIPPPEPFNTSVSNTKDPDVGQNIQRNSNDTMPYIPRSVKSNDAGFSIANGVAKKETPAAPFPFQSNSDEVQDDSKLKRDSYYNLIAPRLFGQKWEKKTFSHIKPPTVTKAGFSDGEPAKESDSAKRSVIKSVPYPTPHRNGRPSLPPKPSILQKESS